jgi:hypothetical protein
LVPHTPPSAPQDRDLVAQDHDLELALTAAAGEQTNETAEEPVQQTGQQDPQSEPLRPSPPARRLGQIEFLYPTGHGFRISLEIRYDRVYEPYALTTLFVAGFTRIVRT